GRSFLTRGGRAFSRPGNYYGGSPGHEERADDGTRPTTFCMATRPSLPACSAWFRLMQDVEPQSRSPGCRGRQETAPPGSQMLASRLQNNWPCNPTLFA